MARNRRKKALYEVINKGWPKDSMPGGPSPLRPDSVERSGEIPVEMPKVPVVEKTTDWPRKPLLVQLGTGRIDFSVPYPMAAAAVLAFVLLLVVVYRAGQFGVGESQGPADSSVYEPVGCKPPVLNPGSSTVPGESPVVPGTGGDNVIVLQEYLAFADLLPARDHFIDNGVQVEIRQEGNSYLLVTTDMYDSVSPGSAGYAALERIKEIGALYKGKAPEGYQSFAPHYFSDAYGKKVK